MSRTLPRILLAVGLAGAVFAASSCAHYTMINAFQVKLRPGSRIGLVMWDNVNGFGSMNQRAMEGYLSGALTIRGFSVTALSNEFMLGEALRSRLIPEGSFSGRAAVVEGLRQGGEIQGDTQLMSEVISSLETDDAIARLKSLRLMKATFLEGRQIEYILAVERFAEFGFSVYLIDTKNDVVVNTLTAHGNVQGFEEVMGSIPALGRTTGSSEPYTHELRLASYIAGLL